MRWRWTVTNSSLKLSPCSAPANLPDRNFEQEHIVAEQASRYEGDAWEETIRDFIESESKVTIGQVARDALSIETPRISTADQRRVAAALELLGWRRLPRDS